MPFLSIVIPAHNEAHRLPGTLEKVLAFLRTQPYSAEVLVVENGSTDNTLALARAFQEANPDVVRVLHEERRGKGLAVQRGMLAARGEYRFLCDADLSMPIEELPRFLPPQLTDFDIAIGSRELPESRRLQEPAYRHLIGRAFNLMVQALALPGFRDTQCGFKCFRGEVADDVFRYQTMTGMSFDVEILFIARRRGYRIVEVPITWYFDPDSRVRLVHDSMRMAIDLLAIRWNALRGRYDPPKT
ncbi:MAG: glycosyltransferase family 2 protein [Chloroflexi bacterium]|nr:glycosyltransferase family 2 protein [Chloroflexota bacterium]